MVVYRVCGATDKGRVRELNEDYYMEAVIGDSDIIVLGVADGVGGLMAGEVASKIALTTFASSLIQSLVTYYKGMKIFEGTIDVSDDLVIQKAVKESIDRANQGVRDAVRNSGTTLVAALVFGKPGIGYIINVGDSRAYIVSGNEIHQITRDHSVPWRDFENELKRVEWDKINWSDSASVEGFFEWKRKYLGSHPKSHVIWNVLGYFGEVDYFDIFRVGLYKGDKLLLTTDGLTDMANDYEILEVMKNNSCEEAARELVKLANNKGGEDNITVAILEVA